MKNGIPPLRFSGDILMVGRHYMPSLWKVCFDMGLMKMHVDLVESNYETTGHLWEKYNVVDGSVLVSQERLASEMPPMMGWSAGVYLYMKAVIKTNRSLRICYRQEEV